eukprot:TRINITY_DN10809_c0_g1_i1.p1 TRINITY_DN10809_c0_g1~~TRINITY_DN10809_c0_g1_i1.p1  ORF type:complete len:325 (+),score=53.25 TRINITY_DN10809_c0_g1_i1:122-1096(+)
MPPTEGEGGSASSNDGDAAQQPVQQLAGAQVAQESAHRVLYAGLLAGATSGSITKTATAPLERIKILSQVNKSKLPPSLFAVGAEAVRTEGVRSLWKGNFTNCLRVIPQYSLKFGVYDFINELVKDPNNPDAPSTLPQKMTAGAMSGVVTILVCHPLQVLRTRLSLPGNHYNGVVDGVRKIISTEGPLSFYRGLTPTILSGTPYISLQLTFHYGIFRPLMPTLGIPDGPLASGASGLCSNLCAQLITYPGEVVRTRMISDGIGGKPPEYGGKMREVIRKTFAKEGFRGFFKGYMANAVRAFPASILQFVIYDETKKFYNDLLVR